MDMHRVTAKGGPLHSKTFDVPHNMTSFPADGGRYKVTAKQATWQPDAKPGSDADLGESLGALAADLPGAKK